MNVDDTGDYLIGRWRWVLRQFSKRMWVRASMFSVAAVAVALVAAVASPYMPTSWELTLAAGSVGGILNILASSMLAVTTFSLSIMVSAYGSATSNVTPRATMLLITDSVATNTLSTFIGTFLFSIVGIVGLAANIYGDKGRIILFLATLVVIFLVVAALLRWIQELNYFGRVGDTTERVEDRAVEAAFNWGKRPRLGANPSVALPPNAAPIYLEKTGYLQHVDVGKLQEICEDCDAVLHLRWLPGAFVHGSAPVAHSVPELDGEQRSKIQSAFSVGKDRDFDQDPRFGLVVLSEIASRALSPGINDPGTAIAVLGAGVRVFQAYGKGVHEEQQQLFDNLYAPDIEISNMFDDFFNPISRDGSGTIEVMLRLQKNLEIIALSHPKLYAEAARRQARESSMHSTSPPFTETEMQRLKKASEWDVPDQN